MAEAAPSSSARMTSLSARLLLLTVIFVMLAEVLIWTPSVARFRKNYIEDYIGRAYLSILALEALRETQPNASLENALLKQTDTLAISLRTQDRRVLIIGDDMPPRVDVSDDMMDASPIDHVFAAFDTLLSPGDRVIRAVGMPPNRPDIVVEVIFNEARMRTAMVDFSVRIFNLSIIISLITATLVFVALQWMIVRPVARLTRSMVRFRENPEAAEPPKPITRTDEIGVAQRELVDMQKQVQALLRQKDRLATLGTGMAKINHDLRNTLATAMLVSDRLAAIADPEVKRVTPRLMRAIDRAIDMCSQTLLYASDPAARRRTETFSMREVFEEVRNSLPLERDIAAGTQPLLWKIDVDPLAPVTADRQLILRAVFNLCNNAVQSGAKTLHVTMQRRGADIVLDIADDGPGLPAVARENLFKPFTVSGRNGGTGLGLVIVQDCITAHGGAVLLLNTGPEGTTFRIELPQSPSDTGTPPEDDHAPA